MRHPVLKIAFFCLFFFYIVPFSFGQTEAITYDVQKDKPKKFQNKVLKSEKTGEKKFTLKKRIGQNIVSHYNYYFNANNKLNAVLERARMANKDNYRNLIPFYGYSLNTTAAQKTELDSVIYKATAGILLHDLRSDWVDNLYLLIGKSYFFQKEFDSASMTFQFINYNLYPRKKHRDEQLIVGTNLNRANNELSIASKENRTIIDKAFTQPPSRNDALVWQVRTLTEMGDYPEAAGLINTLHNDQNFPARLKPDLEEVNAYWFYKQAMYDSAANHLEKALAAADDKQDKARWEYLLAQLFEITRQPEKASEYYNKAMRHTTDPLLDIYANLNNAKMLKSNEPKEIDISIGNLLRMAKRDKYENYRDIIYYSAGELSLERADTAAAIFYFKKSITYATDISTAYKNRSYLQLADLAFNRKDYKSASAFYDSLQLNDEVLIDRAKEIAERKNALNKIVQKINIIEREDSLQKVALMPSAERETYIKNLVRKLRREKGIKGEDVTINSAAVFDNSRNQSLDLFSNNTTQGAWYFDNPSIKARGFSEFRTMWGQRQNVDNWRRRSATDAGSGNINVVTTIPDASVTNPSTANITDITYNGLLNNLPTTPEKLNTSNALIAAALFDLGKMYQNNLEDYRMAAETYETSLQRFPNNLYGGEIYSNLYFCYLKLGEMAKASYYKNLLLNKFDNTKFAQYVKNPQAVKQGAKDPAATKRYENIYNLFIEGNFEQALHEKKAADSLYGNNYWSPQLLYIESVYYIKQKQDSQAIATLNNIINQYPASLLKEKAITMIDVLKRRKEIEDYLTKLNVTRLPEDAVVTINDEPAQPKKVIPTVTPPPLKETKPSEKKEVTQPKPAAPPPVTNGTFTIIPEAPHNVLMILDKVDPVYVSEARNAFNRYNREKFSDQAIDITKDALDKDKNLLVFGHFANADAAISYLNKIKADARSEVSWLPANKYSFIIISDANLQVLKFNKDLSGYIKLLNSKYAGKF